MNLTGSSGSIYLDLFHGFSVRETAEVSRRRKILRPFAVSARRAWVAGGNLAGRAARKELAYPGLSRLISRFYAAVRVQGDPPFTREEILTVARASDQILAQAAARSTVR